MSVITFNSLIFPQESYEKLHHALIPYLTRKLLRKNERCDFTNSEYIFFLASGGISVISNGFSSILKGPFVFGLTGCLGFRSDLHTRACNDTALYAITTRKAVEIIRSEGLWEDVCRIIVYNNMLMDFIHTRMRNPSISARIRVAKAIETIFHLQNKYELKPFLAKEIMSLTLLSRSVVMKHISFFKENKIIGIHGGFLNHLDEEKLHQCFFDITK